MRLWTFIAHLEFLEVRGSDAFRVAAHESRHEDSGRSLLADDASRVLQYEPQPSDALGAGFFVATLSISDPLQWFRADCAAVLHLSGFDSHKWGLGSHKCLLAALQSFRALWGLADFLFWQITSSLNQTLRKFSVMKSTLRSKSTSLCPEAKHFPRSRTGCFCRRQDRLCAERVQQSCQSIKDRCISSASASVSAESSADCARQPATDIEERSVSRRGSLLLLLAAEMLRNSRPAQAFSAPPPGLPQTRALRRNPVESKVAFARDKWRALKLQACRLQLDQR